ATHRAEVPRLRQSRNSDKAFSRPLVLTLPLKAILDSTGAGTLSSMQRLLCATPQGIAGASVVSFQENSFLYFRYKKLVSELCFTRAFELS
ncbi:Uncharacterized protein DAT39_003694, partial [Clarias magur]